MRPGDDLPGHETPFYLFGNARSRAARTLDQLIVSGVVPERAARDLITAARSGASLAVVAPGSGAGKSSLLAALLPHIPAEVVRYHLRGTFETFAFAELPDWQPRRAVMIANEVSNHLPVYLPPERVPPALGFIKQGARLWCTAHARDLGDLLAILPVWPAQAPLVVVGLERTGAVRIEHHPPPDTTSNEEIRH